MKIKMEIKKELIEQKKAEFPGCKIVQVDYKGEDEKSIVLTGLVRSPNRQVISEAVMTDVEAVMADDNLFYQAYFAIMDLLPFQKPDVRRL